MLDSSQIQRIVDTTVQRLRNWANVQQLAEAGPFGPRFWAILDGRTPAPSPGDARPQDQGGHRR